MKRKLIFLLVAALLLTPWPVAYTYDNAIAVEGKVVRVEAAEPSATPTWNVFQNAIGGVNAPGDLFYIDVTDDPSDLLVTLYLTNTHELINSYRYMILKAGVYIQSSTDVWQEASGINGELIHDTYITLSSGQVSFTLPGYAKYKVTIDNGCFYCFGGSSDENNFSPKFYLDVVPHAPKAY